MISSDPFLELIWDQILSRDAKKINAAYPNLDPDSQKTVVNHLQRMVTENDWHPEQVRSARIALDVIKELDPKR
ncbi:MAG: hypothetical protein NTZ74_02040 [Chloroflexi bacterium]|nr:hypothetical protein [Chloroflexota bacterium]